MSAADLRSRLDQLDMAIAQDQIRMDERKEQRLQISRQLDAIIYPVLTLPPEIICLIFTYVVESYPMKFLAPLGLLHICRTWRFIALAHASLWDEIYFNFDAFDHDGRTPAQIENHIDSWARRARNRPLDIFLWGDMVSRLGSRRAATALMTRLAPRVRNLQLQIPNVGWKKYSPSSLYLIKWPILGSLTIKATWEDRRNPDPRIGHTFALAPRLQRLRLSHISLSSVAIPSKQLTEFSGHALNLTDCVEVLRAAENLTECTFYLGVGSVDETGVYAPLCHPSLRTLELLSFNDGIDLVRPLLPLLTLPALQTFILHGVPDEEESFVDFLLRHSEQLATLDVEYAPVEALRLAPLAALTSLTMIMDPLQASDFFVRLEDPDARFLPSVRHISFGNFRSKECGDYEHIARAVSCRSKRHYEHGLEDVALISSFRLGIEVMKDESLGDFVDLFRPLVDLQCGELDVQVHSDEPKEWGDSYTSFIS